MNKQCGLINRVLINVRSGVKAYYRVILKNCASKVSGKTIDMHKMKIEYL